MNLRDDAARIFEAGLRAADPSAAVTIALEKRQDAIQAARRVFVVGAGKASGTMARAAERVLKDHIHQSCVIVKDGDDLSAERLRLCPAGHPVPDARGVAAAQEIAVICARAEAPDLVVFLLSGGASALMPFPAPPITLEEKQETTRLLLQCGADIREMNAVRKHMSSIKGGQLARLAHPAYVLTLILSDVVGDPLDVIGSGPTAPDPSTFEDARGVIRKYGVGAALPSSVAARLAADSVAPETPKAGDPVFNTVENVILGSNQRSLEAAQVEASRLGYSTMILSSSIEGETRDVAGVHAAIARQIHDYGQPLDTPACVISGGETTVTIRGDGKGGRNQEFVLAAALGIQGLPDVVVFSAGTDGTDGPTDAAGAIADGDTVARSARSAKEALSDNDSYHFFRDIGDLVITGSTGTNVMDLRLLLVGRS